MLLTPLRRRIEGGRRRRAVTSDLTGGLADVKLDMAELAAKAREQAARPQSRTPRSWTRRRTASSRRCHPRRAACTPVPPPSWKDLDVDPADLVVIVGGAELGPYGSSRTRFEMEVDNELSAAGVLELAWTTGLDPLGGRPPTGLV